MLTIPAGVIYFFAVFGVIFICIIVGLVILVTFQQ